ncbi:hypothetical protein ATANTOWER_018029, partial [Ataeniobius toweri]|nr:hypothetical protein [Ataeniobius toweri]
MTTGDRHQPSSTLHGYSGKLRLEGETIRNSDTVCLLLRSWPRQELFYMTLIAVPFFGFSAAAELIHPSPFMTSEIFRGHDQEQHQQQTRLRAMEDNIDVTSHTEGLNGLSHERKPVEEITNGHSTFKPVINGVAIGHNGKDYTNGSAPFGSLPISALKQNGLLQTLAAGGDEPNSTEEREDAELEKARQEWDALDNIQP